MSSPLLKLSEMCKRHESPTGIETVPVLRDITLEIQRGESVAIVGPSGSGKSTLLNIMGTLDRPSSGQVLLDGRELNELDDIQLAAVRNREIGFIFQSHHLLPQCTVLENVLVLTLATKDATLRNGAVERAKRMLEKIGLGARLTHRPGQLSGPVREPRAQADLFQHSFRALDRSVAERGVFGCERRHQDVFQHGALRQEMMRLKNEA